MTLNRRQLMFAASAALAGSLAAQTRYPERPITLLDPFTASSNTDYFSRVLADEMGKLLGQPIVVENKPAAAVRWAPRRWCVPSPTATCWAWPRSARWCRTRR